MLHPILRTGSLLGLGAAATLLVASCAAGEVAKPVDADAPEQLAEAPIEPQKKKDHIPVEVYLTEEKRSFSVGVGAPVPSENDWEHPSVFTYLVEIPEGWTLEVLRATGAEVEVERTSEISYTVKIIRHADDIFLLFEAVPGAARAAFEADPAVVEQCGPELRDVELVAQDLRSPERKNEVVEIPGSLDQRCVHAAVTTYRDWTKTLLQENTPGVITHASKRNLAGHGTAHDLYVVAGADPFKIAFAPGLSH